MRALENWRTAALEKTALAPAELDRARLVEIHGWLLEQGPSVAAQEESSSSQQNNIRKNYLPETYSRQDCRAVGFRWIPWGYVQQKVQLDCINWHQLDNWWLK